MHEYPMGGVEGLWSGVFIGVAIGVGDPRELDGFWCSPEIYENVGISWDFGVVRNLTKTLIFCWTLVLSGT